MLVYVLFTSFLGSLEHNTCVYVQAVDDQFTSFLGSLELVYVAKLPEDLATFTSFLGSLEPGLPPLQPGQ